MKKFEVQATNSIFSPLLNLGPGYQIVDVLPKNLKGGHGTQNGKYLLRQGQLLMDASELRINYRGLRLEPWSRSKFLKKVNQTWRDVWFGDVAYVYRDQDQMLEITTINPVLPFCSKTKERILGYVNGKRSFLAYEPNGCFSEFSMVFVYPDKLGEDPDFLHALIAIAWWKLAHNFATS